MGDSPPPSLSPRAGQATLLAVTALYATLLALPLFFIPIFAFDWVNHLWLANYVAHHLASSWTLPMFVNVSTNVGNPLLTFYGSALYGTLFPLIQLFGPELGMRIAVFFAFLVPTLAVARLIHRCLGDVWVAAGITIVLSTSLYQLTNIYTRGAVTEFFAFQFVTFGLVLLLGAQLRQAKTDGIPKRILGLASCAIGALCHPPTAYLLTIFFSLPVLAFIATQRNLLRPFRPTGKTVIVILVLIVPIVTWSGLVAVFGSVLTLNESVLDRQLHFFPGSVDHWLARLLPWPMDFRVEAEGFDLVSSPYLSAPLNTVGLLVSVYLFALAWSSAKRGHFVLDRRPLMVCVGATLAAIVASIYLSLPLTPLPDTGAFHNTATSAWVRTEPSSWRAVLLGPTQFAYRLVNLTNFLVIFGSLAVLVWHRQSSTDVPGFFSRERGRAALSAAAAVCALTSCMKVVEVHREFSLLPRQSDRFLSPADTPLRQGITAWTSSENIRRMRQAVREIDRPPLTQYGLPAYTMPTLFPACKDESSLSVIPVLLEPTATSRAVASVACDTACTLRTLLVASPFFSFGLTANQCRRMHSAAVRASSRLSQTLAGIDLMSVLERG